MGLRCICPAISFLHILTWLILCKRHKAGCSVLVFLYKPDLIGANNVKIEKITLMGGYYKLGVSFFVPCYGLSIVTAWHPKTIQS